MRTKPSRIFALPYVDTSFPPERDWTEVDRPIAANPWGRAPAKRYANRVVDISVDDIRQMPDVDLNAVWTKLKDSVVATSLDGFRISVGPFQWHLLKRTLWDARHPALRPRRSIRRRRRELARAPRNTRSLS